jgi:hypothetical protein
MKQPELCGPCPRKGRRYSSIYTSLSLSLMVAKPIPTRATGDETASMDPAHLASTYGGYDGSQILQRVMPQRVSPYGLTQWAHEQPVRGYESEEIGNTPFQESPALARNDVGGGSLWLSTSGAPSWQGM